MLNVSVIKKYANILKHDLIGKSREGKSNKTYPHLQVLYQDIDIFNSIKVSVRSKAVAVAKIDRGLKDEPVNNISLNIVIIETPICTIVIPVDRGLTGEIDGELTASAVYITHEPITIAQAVHAVKFIETEEYKRGRTFYVVSTRTNFKVKNTMFLLQGNLSATSSEQKARMKFLIEDFSKAIFNDVNNTRNNMDNIERFINIAKLAKVYDEKKDILVSKDNPTIVKYVCGLYARDYLRVLNTFLVNLSTMYPDDNFSYRV